MSFRAIISLPRTKRTSKIRGHQCYAEDVVLQNLRSLMSDWLRIHLAIINCYAVVIFRAQVLVNQRGNSDLYIGLLYHYGSFRLESLTSFSRQ